MPAAAEIAWLIPLLPLAGAAFIGLLLTTFNLTMNRLSKPVAVLSMSCIGAAGALSFALMSADLANGVSPEKLFSIDQINLQLGYRIDPPGSVMLLLVSISALLLMLLSHREMTGKKGYVRCFTYLGFFSGALLGLVMSPNLAELFLFWIVLGICSQQLISIWYHSRQEENLGGHGSLVDRLGDLGLFLGTIDLLRVTGNLEFVSISSTLSTVIQADEVSNKAAILLCLLLLVGPLSKSVQLPLHIWQTRTQSLAIPLPGVVHDLMLIGAGLFLALRLQPILETGAMALKGSSLMQSLA
ncbi:MAG: proton-conducting transporter membrane subunit [Prochlorococcus sp.]